ncbi:hypothetical protein TEA_026339 [Camellia sinensis var. sinensis]|uniref:Uncharacterized protein n=1 Tax=Camellia sinensis var. sinensis TaxID=542762 RepID=A0A4S4ETA8_CAMSN|nr:hypothetical protein TEA_026339 [Camellia sinensis var. sinensis]
MKEEEKRSKGHTQSQIEVDKFREELVKHPEKSLPSLLVTISGLFSKLEASIGHFHTVCQVISLTDDLLCFPSAFPVSDSSVDGSYSFPLMFEKLPEVNQEGSQWTDCEIRDAINLIYENLLKLDSYFNVIGAGAANITWDSRASPEDMEEMSNHPIVSKEWSKSREKQGKVRFSHDAENRPYLSRVELRTVLCALAEIVSMRFVNGVGPRPGIMGIDYPTACWLYKNLGYKAYIVEFIDDLTKPFVSLYFGAAYLAWLSQYEGRKGPHSLLFRLILWGQRTDGSERIECHGKQHGERFRMTVKDGWGECHGCLDHERVALLQLKASSINHHRHPSLLPTWVEAWEGETTTDCYLKGLNNLEQLDISMNQFDSFITHLGFERLSVLGKLEVFYRRVYGDPVLGASQQCAGLFSIGSFLAMGVFEYRSLFGKAVGGLRSGHGSGVSVPAGSVQRGEFIRRSDQWSQIGWLKIRRMYEAWVFGVGRGW